MVDSTNFQAQLRSASQKTAPHIPTSDSYETLAEYFKPVFRQLQTGASDREADRSLPFAEIATLNRAGFTVLRVPRKFGGPGVSIETLIRLFIDLAAADSNIAHQYRSHAGFVESLYFLPDEVQSFWFQEILSGAVVGNASTEIGGNSLGTLNTTLQLDETGAAVLNGTKYYATGSAFGTHTRVSATLIDPDGTPRAGRGFAVVSTVAPGVELLDDWDGFGQRLTSTGTARFSDVHVAPPQVLPRVPGSIEAAHEAPFFQTVLLAVSSGIAQAALNDTVNGVKTRKRTFNTGTGEIPRHDPLILEATGRIAAQAFSATATTVAAAASLDRALAALDDPQNLSTEIPPEYVEAEIAVDSAQVIVPELAIKTASELFLTGGASNTLRSKNLDRHWRNAQTVATHNPSIFRARAIGDWLVNDTPPQGLTAIGDATETSTHGQQGA